MSSIDHTEAAHWAPALPKPRLNLKFNLRRLAIIGGILLAGAAAADYGHDWWTNGRFMESTDDAYIGGDVTAISPHVTGFVSQIFVRDNEHVRAGQLVLRLDDRDFRAAADHAGAVVRAQQAALTNLEAKYTLQQSLIRQADADLSAKAAQADFAHDDNLRYQSLMRAVATSRQDVQRAAASEREANSGVASSHAGAAAARQQLAVLDTEIDEARASIAQAEADLRTANLNLGYTQIRSPVDGYVGNRAARVGSYVTAGAYLVSIIPAHGLWIDANFKEDQLARIRPGQSATATADVLPGHVFHGHVISLAPGTGAVFSVIPPENATGNFTKIVQRVPVRIVLDGADATLGDLRPGLSITAEIDTRSTVGSAP